MHSIFNVNSYLFMSDLSDLKNIVPSSSNEHVSVSFLFTYRAAHIIP